MLNSVPILRKTKGVYYGWWVLTSTFVLGVMSGGIFSHSNGIFFGPIRQDLGLSSAQTSLIFSLSRAQGSFAGPIIGRLVDRFGARPMIIAGGLMASAGFIFLHWVHSYVVFVLIFVGVVAFGKSAGLGQTLLSAINRWFIRRRALAMSICITGFSSGGAVLLPLITIGVHTIGWRDVMLYSGIFMGLILVPLAAVVRTSPESMGLEPDGGPPARGSVQGAGRRRERPQPYDFTVRQALRTKAYWVLLAASVFRVSLWGAVSVHAVEMIVWKGMERETAGLMFSLMFFLSVPMRLAAGYLGDRMPLQPLMCGGLVSAAGAMLVMLLVEGNTAIYLFVLLMALEQGGSTLNWVALGNYFGRANFATLMGIVSTCFNAGMFISPIFAGWVFDRTQSYSWVMITFLPLYLVAGALFLVVRAPAPPVTAAAPGAASAS